MKAKIEVYNKYESLFYRWCWNIQIYRGPRIKSPKYYETEQLAQHNAEKWFKKFGFYE